MILFSMDDRMRYLFELFVLSISAEGSPPSLVRSAPVSALIPMQTDAIITTLKTLQRMPIRILFHFVQYGAEHKVQLGEAFVGQLISLQIDTGLWLPNYQIVGGRSLYQGVFENATLQAMMGTSYGSFMFSDSRLFEPVIYAEYLPGFNWWLDKMASVSAVDLNEPQEQERYGLERWPSDMLQSVLQRLNSEGGLLTMFLDMPESGLREEWFKTDSAMRQVLAHNCFLHRGGRSVDRNSSLFRGCLTAASHEFKHLLLGIGYDQKQELEDNFYLFNPVFAYDPNSNSSVQHVFNPIVLSSGSDHTVGCTKAGQLMGYHSPVWGDGVQAEDPPIELLNCTPGMFRTQDGDCEWCPSGHSTPRFDSEKCDQCSPGTYSLERSPTCNECPPGKASERSGSDTCNTCLSGTYAATNASSKCSFCPQGTWSNTSEATQCNDCSPGYTTINVASMTAAECICQKGTYASESACIECMEGLACDEAWPNNWAAQGLSARLLPNYYALQSDPYSTYLCMEEHGGCPGGPVEFCDNGRTDFLCAKCTSANHHIVNSACEECPVSLMLVPLFMVLGGSALIVLTYYLANGQLRVGADHTQTLFVFIGLQITTLQILQAQR